MTTLATDLRVVTGLATTALDPLWTIENADQLVAAMYDVLPGVVAEWSLAASATAAEWYDVAREQANVDGAFRAIVEPMKDLGAEALIGWASEPLLQPVPEFSVAAYRAVGGLQKRMVNSANFTITGSAAADPKARGYQRVTRPEACGFCRMVASRGAVFSKATSTFACHEHCHCSARPVWGGDKIAVREYTQSDRTKNMKPEQRKRMNRQAREWIADNLT